MQHRFDKYHLLMLLAICLQCLAVAGQSGSRIADTVINVQGRIVNEQQDGVPGVSIRVKNAHNGTIADEKGNFRLYGIDKNAILQISGINIENREVAVHGRVQLIIITQRKTLTADEVVVSTGYQRIPKERTTGSFAQVDNQLINRSASSSILDRLRGIANGMAFNSRGAEGQEEISIRGRSTLFSNAEPLIVVDNFPYEGDINNLNPNDVLNISILKDAAAASIWGARAANGVIVITTKRGYLNQRSKLSLNINTVFSGKPDPFYISRMKTADIINVEKMLFDNGYYNSLIDNTTSYPALSPSVEILLAQRNGSLSSDEAAEKLNQLSAIDNRGDLLDYSYHHAIHQQYAANFNGGTTNSTYFFSAGYDKEAGLLKDASQRITLTSQNTIQPVKNLQISLGINYITDNTHAGNYPAAVSVYPYEQLVDDKGHGLINTGEFRSSFNDQLQTQGFLDWSWNPAADALLTNDEANTTDARVSAAIKLGLFKGLTMEASYQYQKQTITTTNIHDENSFFTRNLINQFSQVDDQGMVIDRPVPEGQIEEQTRQQQLAHNGRIQVNYQHDRGMHSLAALAGFEAREVVTAASAHTLYGYNDELLTSQPVNFNTRFTTFPYNNGNFISGAPVNASYLTDRFASYFANGSYTLLNKYTVSGSGRIDQSNYFGVKTNQRAVPLWSTGLKWLLSKEAFYKLPWLPYLSLRVTYGFNGNINKSVTALTTTRYLGNNAFSLPYASVLNPPNPNLRWERTGVLNAALDFSTHNGVLSGNVEYYRKRGKDIFGNAPVDGTTGVLNGSGDARFSGNVASMKSQGIDLQLTTHNLSGHFSWITDLIFNYNAEEVTDYQFMPTITDLLAGNTISPIAGKPVFGLYSYQWEGLDNTGDPQGLLSKTVSKDYAKLNNPLIEDLVYNGRTRPPFWGSIRNTFSWKSFSLSTILTYKAGYFFRRNSINYATLFTSLISNADYTLRWQAPGDERITNVPAMKYPADVNRETFYSRSSILVEKGDHIRWQDVQLSYTINGSKEKGSPFSQIRIYSYINNLGILWRANRKGIDPDFQQIAPAPLQMALGVNLTL